MRILFLITAVFYSFFLYAQNNYRAYVDLTKVNKDKLKVVVKTPRINEDKAEFIFPAVIPGSYSRKDFGRFITKFSARDEKGKKLKVKKDGNNVYVISNAKRLSEIEYMVDDTWDAENEMYIFQPGGTNIESGKNFVINHQGFWGYFDGYKMLPYEINVTKPHMFHATTHLQVNKVSSTQDVLSASSYVKLVDNPVMYCAPDTTSFMAGSSRINVSVYSETGKVNAALIASYVKPLAASLTEFFGKLPVDEYYFIMYFPEYKKGPITQFGGYGALEHSYCSFYFIPELDNQERIKSMVLSIAAHEFLHILTPLNIHSEEIHDFDFRNPKMSQHLWMYEGVTEYFAHLIQLRTGLISIDEFMDEMVDKLKSNDKYQQVSFTEMSKNILTEKYKDMYSNVYAKGALIGFLLDIRLQELSNGKMSLRDVMMKLAKKYGPDKPFSDDRLIDEIVAITFPEIKTFFKEFVQGSNPLPMEQYFSKIGWRYQESQKVDFKTFGLVNLAYDTDKNALFVTETPAEQNLFGLLNGDVIIEYNGKTVKEQGYENLAKRFEAMDNAEELEIVYRRGNEQKKVKTAPVSVPVTLKHVLNVADAPDEQQVELQKWLFNL